MPPNAVPNDATSHQPIETRMISGGNDIRKEVEEVFKDSPFYNKNIESEFPKFELSELVLGKLLGRGGFGDVHEIVGVNLSDRMPKKQEVNDEDYELEVENRQFVATHYIRGKKEEGGGDARYACKYLNKEVISDSGTYKLSIKDMAIETYFLSAIEHPHIIKMRAFSSGGMYQPKYFIVLDRLYDTLEKKILKWKQMTNKLSHRISIGKSAKKKKHELLVAKLVVAFDLSAAVAYLHGRNIIHRDLKPDNIGFDIRGDVKIFDFGLAKELKSVDKLDNNTYKLTGTTGSLRYMAPEVYKWKPYNESVDVYSFGVLLWEMHSMTQPYKGYTKRMFDDLIINKEYRPKIEEKWSPAVKLLIKRSWASNMLERPSADSISKTLKLTIAKLRGSTRSLDHDRRRSTFVMRTKEKKQLQEKRV